MSVLLAPSILSADFGRLADEIRAVEAAGADWVHVDVMDGHFVPNLTIGPPVIKSIRPVTKLPFDVHLMIEQPERSVEDYVRAGANRVTVHAEACVHLHRLLTHLRTLKVAPGVSINPATPLVNIEPVLHLVDTVLVMTVNPGFGGQSFIPEMVAKVRDLATRKQQGGHTFHIEVDGGVAADTIHPLAQAGADVFVAGSAVFGSDDYKTTLNTLRTKAVGG